MCISYLLSWLFNDYLSAAKVFPLILIILFYLIPLGLFFSINKLAFRYPFISIFPSLPVSIVLLTCVGKVFNEGQALHGMIESPYFYIGLQFFQGILYFTLALMIDSRALLASNNVAMILD
jgi:hypothetical protein